MLARRFARKARTAITKEVRRARMTALPDTAVSTRRSIDQGRRTTRKRTLRTLPRQHLYRRSAEAVKDRFLGTSVSEQRDTRSNSCRLSRPFAWTQPPDPARPKTTPRTAPIFVFPPRFAAGPRMSITRSPAHNRLTSLLCAADRLSDQLQPEGKPVKRAGRATRLLLQSAELRSAGAM